MVTAYIKARIVMFLLLGYAILAVVLKALHLIDLTIPCAIYSFTGYKCLGCGLTTAAVKIARLDFLGAYQSNALIYLLLPMIVFGSWLDIRNFRAYGRK